MIESVRDSVRVLISDGYIEHGNNLSLYFNRLSNALPIITRLGNGFPDDVIGLYRESFLEWKSMLDKDPDCLIFEMKTASPLLVGIGEQNAHEFGISLQLPWGVPCLPGSSIKGVASAYAERNGGEQWTKTNLAAGRKRIFGGEYAIALFGGMDSREDSYSGGVDFLDAWWIPNNPKPFGRDMVNPHYPGYYGRGDVYPDGTENLDPFDFVHLIPGESFLFAVRGPEQGWREIARQLVRRAAAEWGMGAKTRVGYGRFDYVLSPNELKESIAGMGDEDLAGLFAERGTDTGLAGMFAAECRERKYSPYLDRIFREHRPVRALLEKVKSEGLKDLAAIKKVREGEFSRSTKSSRIDKSDPDVQEFFGYCLPLAGGEIRGTWLEAFAFGWEDVFRGKTAKEIELLIIGYDLPWPPFDREEMLAAIRNLPGLSEADQEECAGLITTRLEEDMGK